MNPVYSTVLPTLSLHLCQVRVKYWWQQQQSGNAVPVLLLDPWCAVPAHSAAGESEHSQSECSMGWRSVHRTDADQLACVTSSLSASPASLCPLFPRTIATAFPTVLSSGHFLAWQHNTITYINTQAWAKNVYNHACYSETHQHRLYHPPTVIF